MPVNTAKIEGRRTVNYSSLQEVLTDAERLGSGGVKAIGNWSPGQIYSSHIAPKNRYSATSPKKSGIKFTSTTPSFI